jgi:hypothetical protein
MFRRLLLHFLPVRSAGTQGVGEVAVDGRGRLGRRPPCDHRGPGLATGAAPAP